MVEENRALKAENERLKIANEALHSGTITNDFEEKLMAENERLKDALKKIAQMDGTMMIHAVADEALGD